MSKVEVGSIPAILDAIVGSTSANGDTHLDNESLQNVEKLEAVCGWVCDRINEAYSGDYPKQCASAEHVAHAVRRASGFILDYMRIDRAALLALADDIDKQTDGSMFDAWLEDGHYIARRIREAVGA